MLKKYEHSEHFWSMFDLMHPDACFKVCFCFLFDLFWNVFARLCVAFGLDPFPCILLCSSSLGLGSYVKDIWFGSCDPSRLSGITLKGSKAKTRTERLRPSPPSDAYRSWMSFSRNVLLASWPDMWDKSRRLLRGSDSDIRGYPAKMHATSLSPGCLLKHAQTDGFKPAFGSKITQPRGNYFVVASRVGCWEIWRDWRVCLTHLDITAANFVTAARTLRIVKNTISRWLNGGHLYYIDLFCTWLQAAYACGHSLLAATFDCRHTSSCCGWPMSVFLYVLESFQQVSPADCHWQIQRRSQSVKKEWNQSSRFLKDRKMVLHWCYVLLVHAEGDHHCSLRHWKIDCHFVVHGR